MKNRRNLLFTMILAIALAGTACDGPAGPKGPAGEDGNANVHTDTLTLSNNDWSWSDQYSLITSPTTTATFVTRYVDLDIPSITDDILLAGDIRVYMQPSEGSEWVSLPLDFNGLFVDFVIHYRYQVRSGEIQLHYFHSAIEPNKIPPSPQDQEIPTRLYRWVVIEGALLSQIIAAGVDLDNLEEVQAYFKARKISMVTGTARTSTL